MENKETSRECSYPAPIVPEITGIQKRLQKLCEEASGNAQNLPEIVVPPEAKSKKKKKKKKKKNAFEDEPEDYVDYSESDPGIQVMESGAMGFPPMNVLESGAMGFPPIQMESVPLESTSQEATEETHMEMPPEEGGLAYPLEEGDFSQHGGGIRGHGRGPFRGRWRGRRGYKQGGGPPFHAPPGPGGAFTPPPSQYSGMEGSYYQGYQAHYDPSYNYDYSQYYGQGGPPSQYGGLPVNPQGPGYVPTDTSGWDQSAWGYQNQQMSIPYPQPVDPNQQNPLLPPVPVEPQAVTMANQPEKQLVVGPSQQLPNIPLPPPPSEPPSSIPLPQPFPQSQPSASDIPLPPSDIPMPPSTMPTDIPSNQITKDMVDLDKDVSVLRKEALASMDVPALSPAEPEEVKNVSECVMPSGEKALVVDTTPIVGLSPTAELLETETKQICDSKLLHHTVSDFKPGTSESGSSESKGDSCVFKDNIIESKDAEDSEKKDDNQSKPLVKTTAQMLLEKIAMKKKATETTESADVIEAVADGTKRKTLKPGSKFLLQQLKQDAGKVQFSVKHGITGPKKGNALQKSEKTETEDISKYKSGARELYKPSDQDKVELLLETMTPKQRDSYLRYQEQKEREAKREERRRQRELEKQKQEEKDKDVRRNKTESIEKEMDISDIQKESSSPQRDHAHEQIVVDDKNDDRKSEERTKQLNSENSVGVKEKDSYNPSIRFDSDIKKDNDSTHPLALSGMDNQDKQTIITQSSMLHQTLHSTSVLSPKLDTENGNSSQTVPSKVHRVEGVTINQSSEGTQSDKSDKKKKSRWSEAEMDISSSANVSAVIGGVPAAVPMPTDMEVYSPDHPTGSPQTTIVTGDLQKYSPEKPTGMEYSPSHPTEDYSPSRPTDTPSPRQPAQENQHIEVKDYVTTSDTRTNDQPSSVSGEQLNKECENIGTSNTKSKKKKSKKKSRADDRSLSGSPKGRKKEKKKEKSGKVFPQVKASFSWDSDDNLEQSFSDTKHYSRSRSRSHDSVDSKQKEKSYKHDKRLKSPKHKKHSRSRSRSVDSRSHKRSVTPKKRKSRSPTPRKRKSISPTPRKRKSISPTPRKRKSRSPTPRKRRSRSPTPRKRMSRSPTPRKRKSISPTPRKRRSRSPPPRKRKSLSPAPRKRKSRSPTPRKRRSRSPTPRKQRSRSLTPRKCRSRSATPRKRRSRSKSQSRSLDTKDIDRKSSVKSKSRFSSKHKSRSRSKSPSVDRIPRKDKSVIKTSKNRSRSRSADSFEEGGKRKMSKNRYSFQHSKSRSRTRSRSRDLEKDKSSRRSSSPKYRKKSPLSRSRSRSWERKDGKKRKSKKKHMISPSLSRSRSRSMDSSRKRKDERDRSGSISPKQNKSERRKKKQSHSSDRSRSSSPVYTKPKRNRTASNKQSESPYSMRRGRRESPQRIEDNTVSPYRRRRNSSSSEYSKVSSSSKKTSYRKSSLSPYQSDEDKRRKSPKRKSKKSKGKSPIRDSIPKESSKDSRSVSPKREWEREAHEGFEKEKSPEVMKETRAPISFKMNISKPMKQELPSLGNKLDDNIGRDADGNNEEGSATDLGENLRQREKPVEKKSETQSKLSESSVPSSASTHSPVRSPAQDVSKSKCEDSNEEQKLSKKAKKAAKKSKKKAKKIAKEKLLGSSNSSLNVSTESMDVDENSPDKALDSTKVEDRSEGVQQDLSSTNDASDKVSSPESKNVKRRSWRSKASNSDEDAQKASPGQGSAEKHEKISVCAIPLPGQESSKNLVKKSSISISSPRDEKAEKFDSSLTDLSLIPMPGEMAAIGKEFKTAASDTSSITTPESQSVGKEDVEENPGQNENTKPSVTKSEDSDVMKNTEEVGLSLPEQISNPVDVSEVKDGKDSKQLAKSSNTNEEKIKRELKKLNIDMVKSTFDLEGEQAKRRSRRSCNSTEKEEENEPIEASKRTTRRRSKVSISTEDLSESENSQTEATGFQSCSDTEKPNIEVVQEIPDAVKEKPARRRKSRFSDVDDKTDNSISLTPENRSEPSMIDMSPDPDKLPKVSVTLEPIRIEMGNIRTPIKFALANVTQSIGKVKWDEEEGDSEKETEASFKFVPDEEDPEISFKVKDDDKKAKTETGKEGSVIESMPETTAKDNVPLVVTYPRLSMPSVSSSRSSETTKKESITSEKEDIFQIALRKAKELTDSKVMMNIENKILKVPTGEDNIETVDMECDSNSNSQEPFIFEGNGNHPQSPATTLPLTTFPKFTGGFSLESMIPDFGMPLKDGPSTERKPNPPAPVPPPMDIPLPPRNPPLPPQIHIPPPRPVMPPPQPVMPPAFLHSVPLNQPPIIPLPVRAPSGVLAPVSISPMTYPPIGTPLPQSTSLPVLHTDIPLPPPPPDKSAIKEDKSLIISPAAKPPNPPTDIPMPPEKTKNVGNHPHIFSLKDIPAPPSKETVAQKDVCFSMSTAETFPRQEDIPLPSEMIRRKVSELQEPIKIVPFEKQRTQTPKQQSVSPEREMITVEATIENIAISSINTPSTRQSVDTIKVEFTSGMKPQEKESDETGAENVNESKDTEKSPSVDMAILHKTSVELSKQALLARISAKPKESMKEKKISIGRISRTPLPEKSTEKLKDESEMSVTMKKTPMIKIGPIMMSKNKDSESAFGESSEDGEIRSESENEIKRRRGTIELDHSIPISPLVKVKPREDLNPASSGFGLMPKKVIDSSVWMLENPLPEVTNPVSSASESEDSKLDDKEYIKKVDEFLKKVEKPKTTVERKFDEFLEKVRKPKLDTQSLEEKVDEFLKKTEKKDTKGSSHDDYKHDKSSKHDKDDYDRYRDRDRDRKDKDREYREKERDHREKDREYRGKDRKFRNREYDDRHRDYGERHREYDERQKRRDRRGSRERSRSRERYRERGRERSREKSRSRSRSRSRDRDRRYYEKRSKRSRHERDERRHRDSSDEERSPKHKSRHGKSNKEEDEKKKLTDEWLKFESQLAAKKKMLAETSASSAAPATLQPQQPAVQPAPTEYYQDAYGNYYPVPVNQANNASAYQTYPQYPSVNPSTGYPIPPQQAMVPQSQVYPHETYPPLQQVPPQSSQMYNVPNTPVYNTQGQPGHQEMMYGQEQSLHPQVQPTPSAAPRAAVVYGQVPTQPSILSAISSPATVPPTAMAPSLPHVSTPAYPSQSGSLVQNMAGVQPLSQPEVGSVCPMNRLPGTPRFPPQAPSTVVRPRRASSPPIFSPPVRPKGYISPQTTEEGREVNLTTPTPSEEDEENRLIGEKEETEAQPQQHVTTSEIEESLQPTRNVNRHLPIKLGFKQAIKDSELAQHPPPSTSPQIKEGKPEKVKSRWRRYSELESPSRNTASPSLDVNSVSSSTSQSETETVEEKEILDGKKIVENYDAWDPACELPVIPRTAFTKSEEQKKEKREVRSADTTSQVTEVKPEDEESASKKPLFEEVEDNIYLCERKKTKKMKDVKRMLCDCSTSKEDRDMGYEACGEDCLNRMLYIECGNRCPCGEYCTNKRFHKKQYADVEPFETDWKGMGLRTNVALQPGDFVMEYVGEVLDYKQFKSRVKQQAKLGQEHHYFMALNSDEVIDASYKGNVSRYMNHSCDPNCETQKWTVNGVLRVGFFVKRPVEAMTELNFDYQFERYGKEAQKCFCGSENCRGFIGGSKTTPLRSTRRQEERRKRTEFEDNLLDEELEAITELENGLRNKDHVLNICRLMVRAESPDHRITILKCLQDTIEDNCLRLFLDYHGLELLWSWITDSREGPEDVKIMILSLLKKLPITNKNILKDSKILPLICRLAGRDENDDLSTVTNPIILGQRGETRSILSTSAGKDKSQKKRVKFADEASSSDNESHSSTTDAVGETASGEFESDAGQRHKSESLYKQVLKSLGVETEVDQEENTGVTESSPADLPNKGSDEAEKEEVAEEERVVPEGEKNEEKTAAEGEENEIKSEEERKEEEAEMKSDIELQAEELLFLWKDLKELFKIPKKQQVEERKRIEKELGTNTDKDLEILEMIQDKSKQRAAGWDTGIRKRKRPPPPPPPMDDEERKVLLPTPPKISKAEHRKMFEARVKAQDEMAVRERQQQEIFLNQFYSDPNNILYFNRTPNHPLYGMPPDQQIQILQSQPIEVQYQMVQGYNSQEVVEQYIDPNTGMPITAEQLQAMYEHQQQPEVMYTEDGQPIQQVWPQQQVQQQYMSADGQLVSVHQMDQHLVYSGVTQQQMMSQSVEAPGSLPPGTPIPGQSVYIQQIGPYGTQTQLAVVPPVAIATTSSADDDDPPPPPSPPKPKVEKLPPNWKSAKDSEGKTYYYHSVTRQTQWDPPSWDSVGADDAMDLESPLYEEIVKGKGKKTTTAAADTSSETAKKMKDQFRSKMSSYIVLCLNPFRKPDCKAGRIISTEDFKHLARKLTHHVMAKELKHCRHVEDLEVNENVKSKAKDYVRKYMGKFGSVYRKTGSPDI